MELKPDEQPHASNYQNEQPAQHHLPPAEPDQQECTNDGDDELLPIEEHGEVCFKGGEEAFSQFPTIQYNHIDAT